MNKKAFTLVEMMIAIAVFSIGVLTILNLLVNNLYFLDKASTRTQASFLAKEGIELVYNMRDSNFVKEYPRNCIPKELETLESIDPEEIYSYCEALLGSGIENESVDKTVFSINFSQEKYFEISEVTDKLNDNWKERFEIYRLFGIDTDLAGVGDESNGDESNGDETTYTIYTPDQDSDEFTKFARYIVAKPLVENNDTISADNIVKIESHVLYKNGTKTGEVVFESFIGNY